MVLLSIDTLRADRLGFAGGERPNSPALDRLAAEGVVFENARSSAGWTLPAMATVLTGRRPSAHGATGLRSRLRAGVPSLGELLRANGYETRGYVSHVLLGPERGFGRGFDVFDASVLEVGDPHAVSTAEALTDRVLADLDRRRGDAPLFLWVHYFDPHYEYLVQPAWAWFGTDPIDRYDGEIAATDRAVGRLLDGLDARGLADDAVILLTSDHGEEFGGHAGRFHETLHEEVLRVPLVIRAPGLAPGRSATPARHVDVAPTLLARLGIPPPRAWPGRDLLAPADDETAVFLERDTPSRYRQRGIVRGRFKLIVIEPTEPDPLDAGMPPHPALSPGIQLYDVLADPGETRNLYAPDSPVARALLAELRSQFGDPDLGADSALPPP